MQGVGGMHLHPGQFNMIHTPFLESRNTLEKGQDYIAFDILYPVNLLEQLAEEFPSANLFVEKIHAGKPALLNHEHMWMGAALNGIIGRILHFPPGEAGWKFFLENKVREILYQVMVQTGKRYHVKPALTKSEMESIHAAKEIILANMEHHFTISQIARKVCLNDFKLKRGFVKLFGLGPYEFLLQARMNRARELILDSDKSIKEIAALTGYTLLSSFTTAFKKRFHCTPGLLRKNK